MVKAIVRVVRESKLEMTVGGAAQTAEPGASDRGIGRESVQEAPLPGLSFMSAACQA
jgi:hypothetical protein